MKKGFLVKCVVICLIGPNSDLNDLFDLFLFFFANFLQQRYIFC